MTTLQKLIDTLQDLRARGVPDDTPVITEGCDCDGVAGAVTFRPRNGSNGPTVYIRRDNSDEAERLVLY